MKKVKRNGVSQRKTDDFLQNRGRRRKSIEMAANKLVGENGLEVYVMIEIPSNVILADEFASLLTDFLSVPMI
jgi:phosphoenolpyruvate synthase/pyruvate phosphate dikinase